MKYALTIIHGLIAFVLAAGAGLPAQAAPVNYTLTGTLNQTSGPASPFNGVAVTVTVSMDSGTSPNSSNVTSTFAEANYTPNSVQLTAGGLGPLTCSPSTNVTLRDSVTANDRLTLASCTLLTVVMNASVTIGQTLSTSAPAAVASTTATGTVVLTSLLDPSNPAVFSLAGGSLSASGASPPTMSPSPTSASLMADFGTTTPATQAITLDASSPVSYTVSDSGESWLNATPGAGNTSTAVTISANPTGLSPGTYNGTVSVASPGQSTINIPVSFEVVGSLPDLTVSPGSLSFDYQQGASAPAAKQLSVTAGSAVAINVAASTTSGGSWLSATPSSGNTPQTVTVSVNPTGLSPGVYNGTVTVTSAGAANSPQTANVTLNVTAAATISLAPSSLTFNYQSGASNPAAQMVNLTATNGPVSFTAAASTTSGGSWLSVTPTSGNSPQSLSVSVNPGALAPGNYSGMITVTSASASNSPQTVAVTLNVTAAPTISAAPSALSFNFQIGGSNPAAQNVNVTATNGPVAITAAAATSSGGNWLSVTPGSGNTPQALSVSVNPSGLSAGTYNGTVTVTSAAASNSPRVVAVTFTVSAAPTLSVAPSSLTFNYQVGGSTPAAQNLAINGSSAIAFNAAASTSSGGSWLSVSPTSGTTNASASVSVNPTGLSAGTYNGMITVTSGAAGNSPQTVAVTLVVGAQPNLTVSPANLSFSYQQGTAAPAAKQLSVGSTSTALSYTAQASSTGNWLSVTPGSGTTNSSLSVAVNITGLAPGSYNGTVTVTSAGAGNSPVSVPVSLTVTAAPTLSVSPSQLSFNYLIGGSNPASQSISVSANPATPPVSFTAAASGGAWLSVSPTSGSTAATVSVSVNTAGLAPGNYNGTVTVTAASTSNSPQTIAVSLTVTAPTLTVAPSQLSFGFQVGGSAPAPQMVNVSANSATAYTAAASGGAWLSVTPGSGTTDGALTVSVDPTGLAAGTYNGTVTVTAPTAGNSPQAIAVVLTVSAAPVLTVSPSQLTFNFQSGGANPPSQMLNITGSAPLAYNVAASGGAWLSVTPASGNTPGSATVSVNPAGLGPGSYNGTINVTSGGAGNSPQTVAVTLVVSSAPTISASPSALTFNYQIGGPNPAAQNISVGGSSATAFTATAAGGAWLSASPTSGTTDATVSVSANPSGLAPGTYNGTVTIAAAAASNSPQVVAVTLVVTAASFTASPAQLSFTYQLGGTNPPSQSVSVSSASASQFSVSAAGGPWISATPTNGTTPATVSVSVNPAGLSAGSYAGTVTITPQGAGQSAQIVQVALVVTSAPTMSISPATLAFSYQVGGSVPASRTVSVTATSPVNFNATALGGSWLSVTPTSGSTPGSLSVSVDPIGLTPGDYVGTVEITSAEAANSPQVVAVSLTVSGPSVSVSPAQLSFSFQTGGNPPAPQTLTLATTGSANFTATVASGDFLSVTPTSGTAPTSVDISVNPGALEPGTYNGSVAITPEGGSPVTVPVVLTVSSNPILSASPAGLTFQYFVNGAMPEPQAINLTASTEMGFTVAAAGGEWLSVTPAEGTTPASLMAAVDPTGLEPGDYAGSIAVTAPEASNSPVTIPVTLTVILAPVFDADGVVTSTEYLEGDSPASGGLASVFGSFPGIEFEQATTVPLPTRIQGLEVRLRPMTSALGGDEGVAQEVGFVAAPLLFVSPEQISFQAPWEIPPGPVEMIVSAGGVDSAPVEIEFTESNPGIFTFEFGPGPAVAILVDGMVAQPAGSIEGVTTRPARIGEPLVILASGLGPLTGPPLPSGSNSLDETGAYVRRDTVVRPRAFVGGQEAEVYFAGASPEFVGVNQVNLTAIPEGVEPGPAVPLVIEVNGVQSRMDVTIAVDPAPQQ